MTKTELYSEIDAAKAEYKALTILIRQIKRDRAMTNTELNSFSKDFFAAIGNRDRYDLWSDPNYRAIEDKLYGLQHRRLSHKEIARKLCEKREALKLELKKFYLINAVAE